MIISGIGTYAQQLDSCNYELAGVILDADTKDTLPYVQVKVKDTPYVTTTDASGKFSFKGLCSYNNTLIISCFGYCDTICESNHEHGKASHFYLKHKVQTLGSVTIKVEKLKETGTTSISQVTIGKDQLQSGINQTLASALSEVDGLTFTSTGNNVQLPVIHGLYGNRILILNNGIKHGFQNWGTDHAPEIDVASAENITLVKGAAGVRYGPEAIGGAVIIESDPLYLNEPLRLNLGTGYQSNGRGYFVNTKIAQGLKNWSYHIGANYNRVGDLHSPDYSLTNSGKKEMSVNGGVRYRLHNFDFKVYYSYINQNLALLRSSIAESGNGFINAINSDRPLIVKPFSYDINEPNQLTEHHLAKAEVTWWYANEGKLTFRYGTQLNGREEYDVRRNADKPIIDLDLLTNDYQLEWKHPDWLKLDGLVGLQAYTQDNDNNPGTGTTPFIPNYNSLRYSGFIIESYKKNKNTFELGLRLDYEYNNVRGRETNQDLFKDEYSFTNLTSSIGYVREVSDNTTFRTNIGTAWRTPNMSELYSFGQHGFKTSFGLLRYYTNENGDLKTNKVIIMNDSDVDPEKGYKWINEWQTQNKSNRYTVVGYSHYIQNFIYERPIAVLGTIRGPMPAFIFDQTDALFFGVDFTWNKEWSKTIEGTYGLSYLWSKDITRNEFLINQPPITTSYNLVWKTKGFWKIQSSKISIKPSYTFTQFQAPRTVTPEELISGSEVVTPDSEVFDFKDAPVGYFLFDVAWHFKFKSFEGMLAIQNVFNTRYRDYLNEMRYFADEPGRNVLLSINYKFKSKKNESI